MFIRWGVLPSIPLSLFLFWLKPWANYREPIQWPEFQTEWLDNSDYQTKPLLVFVNSTYGFCDHQRYSEFDSDERIIDLVDSGCLNVGKIDFAYVTTPPPERRDEYDWVYEQPTYHKDCFFILLIPDQDVEYFTIALPVEALLDRLGNPPFRSNVLLFLWIIATLVVSIILIPLRLCKESA